MFSSGLDCWVLPNCARGYVSCNGAHAHRWSGRPAQSAAAAPARRTANNMMAPALLFAGERNDLET
jgi:hypothetical protein